MLDLEEINKIIKEIIRNNIIAMGLVKLENISSQKAKNISPLALLILLIAAIFLAYYRLFF